MNFAEMYITAYYERVRRHATISNLRFRGPAGRNWSDLDIVAIPLPPMEADGKTQRVADVVQCKWRAKFTLGEGDEEWLDSSVVNAPEVHEEAARLLNGWPYRVVLVTTNVWLSTLPNRPALADRLDDTARKSTPSCVGAKLLTFEEVAENWRHELGQAVLGWAEDPFSFQLQVHQLAQVPPPGRTNLPAKPTLSSAEAEAVLTYRHDSQSSREAASKWLEILIANLHRKVVRHGEYDDGEWRGVSRSVWGGTWTFLGRVPDSPAPVFSTWHSGQEILRVPLVSEEDLARAAKRFYAWWSWGESA